MTTSLREKLAADWKWGTLSKDNAALALGELAEFDDDEVKALLEEAKFKEPVNGRFLSFWLGFLGGGRFYKGDKTWGKVAIANTCLIILVVLLTYVLQLDKSVDEILGFCFIPSALFIIYSHSLDGQFVFVGIQKDNMKKFLATLEKYKAKKGKK